MDKKVSAAILFCSLLFLATTNHTIIIDGTNDFAADEDLPGTSGSTWYMSWDATNFYFGVTAPDVNSGGSSKWVVLYLDTDPQTTPLSGNGTSTGVMYNTQQPILPFNADYHFRWKADNNYTNLLDWNAGTSSWTDDNTASMNAGIAKAQSGTFVEFKIPRSSLGDPANVHVAGCMLNEQAGNEWTYHLLPDAGSDGYDVNLTKLYGFPLETGISPDNAAYLDTPLPVEFSSFTSTVHGNAVELKWQTSSETDNYGFEIERRRVGATDGSGSAERWTEVGFVPGRGTTGVPATYVFTDVPAASGRYAYRLIQMDVAGSSTILNELEVVISAPGEFGLMPNMPNPFNPSTRILFTMRDPGHVRLTIVDLTGREVALLVDEDRPAGRHNQAWNASGMPSGVYFCRLTTGEGTLVRKMMLLR